MLNIGCFESRPTGRLNIALKKEMMVAWDREGKRS